MDLKTPETILLIQGKETRKVICVIEFSSAIKKLLLHISSYR